MRIFWVALQIFLGHLLYVLFSRFVSPPHRHSWKGSLHKKNALRLQQTAIALKGLIIKVCQFISARVDLMPEVYTQTLSLLQDQVPPAPYSKIRARIIQELGGAPEDIFREFHEVPVAAASLGQVHEAVLKTSGGADAHGGTKVAVKIQYPGIESIVHTDLKAIRQISRILQWFLTNIRLDILYEEFATIVHQEIDYIHEAQHAEQFYQNFASDHRVVVPQVVWQYTTQRVLTLQFVEGIKISRIDEIKKAGINTKEVATLLAESYMKQILEHRFFHGDPHPGNLFVQPGPRLVFVDFGLMQPIPPLMYEGMKSMIMAIIDRDIPCMARSLLDLGFISRTEKTEGIEQGIQFFMERYRDITPKEFKKITIAQIAQDLTVLFKMYPSLQMPNHFILVGRTAGMLNGLCSQLDPDLNIIELAKPYAKTFVKGPDGPSQIIAKGKDLMRALLGLPSALKALVDLSSQGQFRTQMNSEDLTAILTKIYSLAYRTILFAIIVGLWMLYSNPLLHFSITLPLTPVQGILASITVLIVLALFISGGTSRVKRR